VREVGGFALSNIPAAMEFDLNRAERRRGIVLIDAMVYIAVVGVVLILAAAVFDKGMRESAGLQRNVSDIERALKAGERWRADVRAASGKIELSERQMIIPKKVGKVVYEMGTNQVRRLEGEERVEVFLAGVQNSKMIEERRGEVMGWRWELELERRRKEARVRPLFTFMAAGGVR
jgi:hypothetical protein